MWPGRRNSKPSISISVYSGFFLQKQNHMKYETKSIRRWEKTDRFSLKPLESGVRCAGLRHGLNPKLSLKLTPTVIIPQLKGIFTSVRRSGFACAGSASHPKTPVCVSHRLDSSSCLSVSHVGHFGFHRPLSHYFGDTAFHINNPQREYVISLMKEFIKEVFFKPCN